MPRPNTVREEFIRRWQSGATVPEIAEAMGYDSQDHVRQYASRLRKALGEAVVPSRARTPESQKANP
jgi:DNA-directed RNA polymerase specialized sigma24 family protein